MKLKTNLTTEELQTVVGKLSGLVKSRRMINDPDNAFKVEIESKLDEVLQIYSDSLKKELQAILGG